MKLETPLHCGAVRFSCECSAPYPFMCGYGSLYRRTVGAGGFSINLHAESALLAVTGEDAIAVCRP